MTRILILLNLAIFLTGCVTGPPYQNYQNSNAAVLRRDIPNFFKYLGGAGVVCVNKVDDFKLGKKVAYLSPGKHLLNLYIVTSGPTSTEDQVSFVFKANHKYTLTAQLVDRYFDINLVDETDGKGQVVKSITSNNQAFTDSTPIYIPTPR